MYKFDVPLERNRDGVSQRADRLLATVLVREHGELGIEQFVGLADRDGDRKPVASWGGSSGSEAIRRKPFVHFGYRVSGRLDECLDLG